MAKKWNQLDSAVDSGVLSGMEVGVECKVVKKMDDGWTLETERKRNDECDDTLYERRWSGGRTTSSKMVSRPVLA